MTRRAFEIATNAAAVITRSAGAVAYAGPASARARITHIPDEKGVFLGLGPSCGGQRCEEWSLKRTCFTSAQAVVFGAGLARRPPPASRKRG